MYRRYSNVNNSGMTLDQRKRSRLKDIVIAVLVVALIVLVIISYPALHSQSGSHDFYVARMRNECDEAIRLTNTLSRNAGADSAGILAKIRSNIYAMTVVNDFNNQESGTGEILLSSAITTVLDLLDKYQQVLITGMDTGEQQTKLMSDLESIHAVLETLD